MRSRRDLMRRQVYGRLIPHASSPDGGARMAGFQSTNPTRKSASGLQGKAPVGGLGDEVPRS